MGYQLANSVPMQYYLILLTWQLLHFDQVGGCLLHLVTLGLSTEARTFLLPGIINSDPTAIVHMCSL